MYIACPSTHQATPHEGSYTMTQIPKNLAPKTLNPKPLNLLQLFGRKSGRLDFHSAWPLQDQLSFQSMRHHQDPQGPFNGGLMLLNSGYLGYNRG